MRGGGDAGFQGLLKQLERLPAEEPGWIISKEAAEAGIDGAAARRGPEEGLKYDAMQRHLKKPSSVCRTAPAARGVDAAQLHSCQRTSAQQVGAAVDAAGAGGRGGERKGRWTSLSGCKPYL